MNKDGAMWHKMETVQEKLIRYLWMLSLPGKMNVPFETCLLQKKNFYKEIQCYFHIKCKVLVQILGKWVESCFFRLYVIWYKIEILCFKIKLVFTLSSYNVSASCIMVYKIELFITNSDNYLLSFFSFDQNIFIKVRNIVSFVIVCHIL